MATDRRSSERSKERIPYFKYAFHNVYNYSMLAGLGAAALLTQNWWLGILGGGLEALWMVFAPDSRVLRKLWFDKVHEENLKLESGAERQRLLATLRPPDRQRYLDLESEREKILRLCAENPSFTVDLLKEELQKLEQLNASFLDLLVSCTRYQAYLSSVDIDELEADIRKYERLSKGAKDEDARQLAERNLEVLNQRRERIAEIRRFIGQAYSQLDLIENTFRLLADQIVTMQSPRELGGQLDELIGGVEAIRSTAREAEAFFQKIESR